MKAIYVERTNDHIGIYEYGSLKEAKKAGCRTVSNRFWSDWDFEKGDVVIVKIHRPEETKIINITQKTRIFIQDDIDYIR